MKLITTLEKYIFSAVIILLISFSNNVAQKISVMSYNIRVDVESDSINKWANRKNFLGDQLKFYNPNILGVQEALKNQLDFLDNVLTDHNFVGKSRDGIGNDEYSPIFYNSNLFNLITTETFWLSESPNTKSIGWDAALERICTYALLEIKNSGKLIWVFNTHLDHIGEIARKESVKLILRTIDSLNIDNLPVILMGDFNLLPTSRTIKNLSNVMLDTFQHAKVKFIESAGTFNGFNYSKPAIKKIDYIFTTNKQIENYKFAILKDSKNFHYPSDHFPVYAEIILN